MNSSSLLPRLGITMGDPNGIGPEIIIRTLQHLHPIEGWTPLLIGDLEVFREINARLINRFNTPDRAKLSFFSVQEGIQQVGYPVLDLGIQQNRDFELGKLSAWGGLSAHNFLKKAIDLALANEIDAIVTAPLCKEALHAAGFPFPGHTEMLSHYSNQAPPVMMLTVDEMRAIHVTTHMPLREAVASLTPEGIYDTILVANQALKDMGIAQPVIGVPGLNPHAGENGLFGTEESTLIKPAIEKAQAEGIDCRGPYPPDTIFLEHRDGELDAVIALYHDQAHIPLKLWGFERGVNVTLGLPILRTSVDHGTAFDRAASLTADPGSLIQALELAQKMAHFRRENRFKGSSLPAEESHFVATKRV